MELRIPNPMAFLLVLAVGVALGYAAGQHGGAAGGSRYELKAAADGYTAWKFDRQTGEVKALRWAEVRHEQQVPAPAGGQ